MDFLGKALEGGHLYLDTHGASHHSEPRRKGRPRQVVAEDLGVKLYDQGEPAVSYNEQNPGLGLRYEWDESTNSLRVRPLVMGGFYKNSLGRNTNYAGAGAKKRLLGDDDLYLDLGAVAGGATGYRDGLTPMVLPVMSIGGGRFGLNMLYAPKFEGNPETYMFSGSYKLK